MHVRFFFFFKGVFSIFMIVVNIGKLRDYCGGKGIGREVQRHV